MRALIIDDMLNDFVDGALANPNAQAIIEPLQRLLAHARQEDLEMMYGARLTTVDELVRTPAGART